MQVPQFSVTKAALALPVLYLFYILVTIALQHLRHRSLAASKNATLTTPPAPQRDPIFGIDRLWERRKMLDEHRLLESNRQRFLMMNVKTLSSMIFGRKMIITLEPENLKTIQAVDFRKWGLGERRKVGFRPLLGDGTVLTFCW